MSDPAAGKANAGKFSAPGKPDPLDKPLHSDKPFRSVELLHSAEALRPSRPSPPAPVAAAKAVPAKPPSAKPPSAKPASAKPASAKPVSAKAGAAKPVSAKPVVAKPVKPAASTRPVEPGNSAEPPPPAKPSDMLEPVHSDEDDRQAQWTSYLVLFLRIMAGLSLIKGLYHWAAVCGIGAPPDAGFESHTVAWQTATIFFAVFDLVAAVGLWLAAAWGAVVWLTSAVSMAVVELFFPQVYGGSIVVVLVEMGLLCIYLWLAIISAREQPA